MERICSHHHKPLALSQGDWITYGRSVGNANVRASRHNALITLFTQWGKSPRQPDFIGAASGTGALAHTQASLVAGESIERKRKLGLQQESQVFARAHQEWRQTLDTADRDDPVRQHQDAANASEQPANHFSVRVDGDGRTEGTTEPDASQPSFPPFPVCVCGILCVATTTRACNGSQLHRAYPSLPLPPSTLAYTTAY